MERFSQRESVLLGFVHQRPFATASSSPKAPHGISDVDFHDVFGGPPRRRSLIHETRYSFNEAVESEFCAPDSDGETAMNRRPWSISSEKPVFGEEAGHARRYPSEDFFDDIFRGDDSASSTPRKRDQDPFASGSPVLSPARPLPPKSEPFGISSLPAQFSLPAKLARGKELPTFGSPTRGSYKFKDGASIDNSFLGSPRNSPSKFSSQASQGLEDPRLDAQSSYRFSHLSREFSLGSDESAAVSKPEKGDPEVNLKKGAHGLDDSNNGSQRPFHFSIYKWAGKGVPLAMPLRRGKGVGSKDTVKTWRSSSVNGRMISANKIFDVSTYQDSDSAFKGQEEDAKHNEVELGKEENYLHTGPSFSETVEPRPDVEESERQNNLKNTVEDDGIQSIMQNKGEEMKFHASHGEGFRGKRDEVMVMPSKEDLQFEKKPQVFDNEAERGNNKASKVVGKLKTRNASFGTDDSSKSLKKQNGKLSTFSDLEEKNTMNPVHNLGTNRVRGKVKEFVKIFSQGVSSKPTDDVEKRSRSSRWNHKGAPGVGSQAVPDSTGKEEKTTNCSLNRSHSDGAIKVDEYFKESSKEHAKAKTASNMAGSSAFQQDSLKSTTAESTAGGGEVLAEENIDSSFVLREDYLIRELPQVETKLQEEQNGRKDIKVIDLKIREWSRGKEGNIRSLLSTLQYVLWPNSGWKPIPLVDIIEGNAVKRAYQRALLCLHPDKLQQKGAASNQKYLAEKVFDILQEAWAHFNTLSSL